MSLHTIRALRNLSTRTIAASRLDSIQTQLQRPPNFRTMASIPKTMKGVLINKNGGTEVIEYKTDIPVPEPKEGQVLIKNDYCGLNYIDTYFRTGLYKAPRFPLIMGREAAGTIVKVGQSTSSAPIDSSLKEGVEAAYMAEGAFAEYTVANAIHTYALPSGVDTKTGAAALLQALTAITLIREAYPVQKGDWVLVPAAAGGMGLLLCQMLKAAGAHTIGTASTPEKREIAKKAGAEIVLEYASDMGDEAFIQKVKDLTGGEGVAAAYDGVGKATFDTSLLCIKRKGSMISYGNASGAPDPVALTRLSAKNAKLMRPTLFNYMVTREEFYSNTKACMDLIADGKLDIAVHKVYDLKDLGQAQEDLEGRKTSGKLLFKP